MTNTLYSGDNLFILNGMNSESVDLIYLDPPFNSKRTYSAPIGSRAAGSSFKDMWTWRDVDEAYLDKLVTDYPSLVYFVQSIGGLHGRAMMSYVTYMTQRIIELHRVLKETGSLYLHCDPTASHYLKLVLDEVFGKDNFRNEIVWSYQRWTAGNKNFQRTHDCIYRYTKGDEFTFNKLFEDYSKKSKHKAARFTKIKNKKIEQQYTKNTSRKKSMRDVWEISILNSQSKERTGYPTQKPLKLLDRIIRASSKEGDVVLDPFCGCATTCVMAQKIERKWIGIDIEEKAVDLLIQRLSDDSGMFTDFIHRTDIPKRTDIEEKLPDKTIKEQLFKQQQNGHCNGCNKQFDMYNLEIDHIVPKSRGGGDYYENYQLLCGNCNRVKGNRPMEYLRNKIKAREELIENKIFFGD